MISGNNFTGRPLMTGHTYYFSQMTHAWGWATWRDAWRRHDRDLRDWPEIKRNKLLFEVFDDRSLIAFWSERFDEMHSKTRPQAWDYQWFYTNLVHNALCVHHPGGEPGNEHRLWAGRRRLILSTRTARWSFLPNPLIGQLRHTPSMVALRSMDRCASTVGDPPLASWIPVRLRSLWHGAGEAQR